MNLAKIKYAIGSKKEVELVLTNGQRVKVSNAYEVGKARFTQVSGKSKGVSSSIPVPVSTKAKNGLQYKSNPKHTKGQPGNRKNAGIEPQNSLELFENSVQYGKKRYSMDKDGNIHQFTNSNDGTWHWAGRSGVDQQEIQRLKKADIPNEILKKFNINPKGEFK